MATQADKEAKARLQSQKLRQKDEKEIDQEGSQASRQRKQLSGRFL